MPPNCTLAPNCVKAIADGTYPTVFNNDTVDAAFGITAPIFLDELFPNGIFVQSVQVPNSDERGVKTNSDQMVTSFSSKSEIGLNLSLDHTSVSFMGYLAPANAIDVSNSNTPQAVDPTNPVPASNYRVVASVDQLGRFRFTKTNAYSGNNGRAAILNNTGGANVYYTTGNAGNWWQPATGRRHRRRRRADHHGFDPIAAVPAGGSRCADAAWLLQRLRVRRQSRQVGKDNNFRGMTVFENVLYFTKGIGGTAWTPCTSWTPAGRGLPEWHRRAHPGASCRPPDAFNPADRGDPGIPSEHVRPEGLQDRTRQGRNRPSRSGSGSPTPTTLYVADEAPATTPSRVFYLHRRPPRRRRRACRSGC